MSLTSDFFYSIRPHKHARKSFDNCTDERRGKGAQKKGVSLASRAAGEGVFFFSLLLL